MIDSDEISAMLGDCINRQSKLDDWEVSFIYSILDQKNALTKKQTDRLELIWERVTK